MLHGFTDTHRHELRLLSGCLLALALLAAAVTQIGFVSHLDLRGIQHVHEGTIPLLTTVVFAVTKIGNTEVIIASAALAVIVLAALRHWRGALALALSITITELLVAVVKGIVERPRPPAEAALTHANDFSFPSGHAAATTAVFALLVWLALTHLRGAVRLVAVATGVTVMLAVGLSRIYLGVHYPTDVMAGWLVGAALAFASWLIVCVLGRLVSRRLAPATA